MRVLPVLSAAFISLAALHAFADTPATPPPGTLAPGMLKTLLENMGYEAKEYSGNLYDITDSRAGMSLHVSVILSGDNSCLWFYANLPSVASADKIPASVMRDMLLANFTIGPSHFSLFTQSDGTIVPRLSRALDNHGITPALIRPVIENMFVNLVQYEPVWNTNKWPGATTAPATAR